MGSSGLGSCLPGTFPLLFFDSGDDADEIAQQAIQRASQSVERPLYATHDIAQ